MKKIILLSLITILTVGMAMTFTACTEPEHQELEITSQQNTEGIFNSDTSLASAPGAATNLLADNSKVREITFKATAPTNTGKTQDGITVPAHELNYWLYYAKIDDTITDSTIADALIKAVGSTTGTTNKTKGRMEVTAANLTAGFHLTGLTAGDRYRYTVVVIPPEGTPNSQPAPAQTSETVRAVPSQATKPPAPTLAEPTSTTHTGFTITWNDGTFIDGTHKKDGGTTLTETDIRYMVYYMSSTTVQTDAQAVKDAGGTVSLTSGKAAGAGADQKVTISNKDFAGTVYIIVEAINTTDESKRTLSEVKQYTVTGMAAAGTGTPPSITATAGDVHDQIQLTLTDPADWGKRDNNTAVEKDDVRFWLFYMEGSHAQADIITAMGNVTVHTTNLTAPSQDMGVIQIASTTHPFVITNLKSNTQYSFFLRIIHPDAPAADLDNPKANDRNDYSRDTAVVQSTTSLPPSLSGTTSFTLTESGFNDGTFYAISTLTLTNGKFKASKGTGGVYKDIDMSPDNIPSGLTHAVKQVSSTKVEIAFTGTANNHGTRNNATLNLKELVKGTNVPDLTVTFGFTFLDNFANPIMIHNATELQKIQKHLKQHFALANDIDLQGVAWTPMGRNTEFSGTLDGRGHTIRNLKIGSKEKPAGNNIGLFGKTSGATIKNLLIDHSGIWGNNYVGGLVGDARSTTITNVGMQSTTKTAVIEGNSVVGGLVGDTFSTTVSGYATGTVSGQNTVGGLVGNNRERSTVNGYTTGKISGQDTVGGLVGTNRERSTVNGYATGTVSGTEYVGGLVGINIYTSTVSGYTTGKVSGQNTVGGLVGTNRERSTVNGYATGKISGQHTVGGLVGYTHNSGSVSGYVRGGVTSTEGTNMKHGGLLSGLGTVIGYYSAIEIDFIPIIKHTSRRSRLLGTNGISVSMLITTRKRAFTVKDNSLTFGTKVGQWTWLGTGKWPAINLPTLPLGMDGAFDTKKQPTAPKLPPKKSTTPLEDYPG